MKKIFFTLMIMFQSAMFGFGQTGTSSDPYTSLGQAWFTPSSGIYHFNIGGTTFSTYVESGNGWILIASGSANTTESSYTTTTTLTLQSDAILPSSIYTSGLVTDVRINATSGPSTPFDVQSSNSAVLGNLQNDRTLSVGTNRGDWTGTGTARLTKTCVSNNNSLSTHIYHACGNLGNLHWQIGQDNLHEKVDFSNGSKNNLNLWIRAASVPLPIELLNFDATVTNQTKILLEWQTASEINNEHFTIERSTNGIDWEEVNKVMGAGNSSALLSYATVDSNPYHGTSYYRLKQTDFDGQFEYSQIRSINIDELINSQIQVYPNPAENQINMVGDETELKQLKIYNVLGQDVTDLIVIISKSDTSLIIDLSNLRKGMYWIKTKTTANKVYKQ